MGSREPQALITHPGTPPPNMGTLTPSRGRSSLPDRAVSFPGPRHPGAGVPRNSLPTGGSGGGISPLLHVPDAHQVAGLVLRQPRRAQRHHPPELALALAPAQAPDGEAWHISLGHLWRWRSKGRGDQAERSRGDQASASSSSPPGKSGCVCMCLCVLGLLVMSATVYRMPATSQSLLQSSGEAQGPRCPSQNPR